MLLFIALGTVFAWLLSRQFANGHSSCWIKLPCAAHKKSIRRLFVCLCETYTQEQNMICCCRTVAKMKFSLHKTHFVVRAGAYKKSNFRRAGKDRARKAYVCTWHEIDKCLCFFLCQCSCIRHAETPMNVRRLFFFFWFHCVKTELAAHTHK